MVISLFIFSLLLEPKFKCIKVENYIPCARHYNPRFVYFLPTFWSPKTFFQGAFSLKFWPYVWLVFKSGLWWRAYGITIIVILTTYSETDTVFPHIVAAATILFWTHLVRKLFKFSFLLCNENLNSFLTRWGNYSRRGNYSREETIWGNTVYGNKSLHPKRNHTKRLLAKIYYSPQRKDNISLRLVQNACRNWAIALGVTPWGLKYAQEP